MGNVTNVKKGVLSDINAAIGTEKGERIYVDMGLCACSFPVLAKVFFSSERCVWDTNDDD